MDADLNHYVRKTEITRALIDGIPARSLCGETWIPETQGGDAIPGDEVANRRYEVCPECELFNSVFAIDAEEKTEVTV